MKTLLVKISPAAWQHVSKVIQIGFWLTGLFWPGPFLLHLKKNSFSNWYRSTGQGSFARRAPQQCLWHYSSRIYLLIAGQSLKYFVECCRIKKSFLLTEWLHVVETVTVAGARAYRAWNWYVLSVVSRFRWRKWKRMQLFSLIPNLSLLISSKGVYVSYWRC